MAYPFSTELTSAITSSNVLRLGSVSSLWDQPQYRWNPVPGERLRIGYVSPDLKGSHPLGKSIYRLFSLHDKEKFEIFVYFLNADDGSNIYRKIVADAEHTIDIANMTNEEAAARINEDKIHILINLFGHSGAPFSNGIFALKPAPIAILHQGIAGEYGQCDYINYYTADKVILPPESRKKDNPQKALYMPDSYLFLSPPEDDVFPASEVQESLQDNELLNVGNTASVVHAPALSEIGFNYHKARNENGSSDSVLLSEFPDVMKENTFVFCYFGVHWKISPTVYDIWMKVLSRVDNSVLWMMKYKGSAMAMPLSVENLRKEATARGIDQNRILFSSVYPFETHLKIKSVCHMYLDTLEYNLHTVAAETLWTGVPGITWPQVRPASRVGASMLTAIGLPELVTSSAEEYEALAVQYATDKQLYQQLRQKLRENIHTTPLFNNQKWVQDFERGLQDVWHRHKEHESMEDVLV